MRTIALGTAAFATAVMIAVPEAPARADLLGDTLGGVADTVDNVTGGGGGGGVGGASSSRYSERGGGGRRDGLDLRVGGDDGVLGEALGGTVRARVGLGRRGRLADARFRVGLGEPGDVNARARIGNAGDRRGNIAAARVNARLGEGRGARVDRVDADAALALGTGDARNEDHSGSVVRRGALEADAALALGAGGARNGDGTGLFGLQVELGLDTSLAAGAEEPANGSSPADAISADEERVDLRVAAMFDDMGPGEIQRVVLMCGNILANPVRYERALVTLCRAI